MFDVLIANTDRHRKNLAHWRRKHRLEVFDHGNALLGDSRLPVADRLTRLRGQLGIQGPPLGSRHCLVDEVSDHKLLLSWADRAWSIITEDVINQICREVEKLDAGADKEEVGALRDFLAERRTHLGTLLRNHREEFTRVDPNDWGLV